jgi:hypothetical protein
MASFITPRVNATYLDEFKTKNVRIVGQVTQVHGDNVVIGANGQIQLNLSPAVGEVHVGQFYEIIGTVQNDLSVNVSGVQDFGNNVGKLTSSSLITIMIIITCFSYFFLMCMFSFRDFMAQNPVIIKKKKIPYQ